MIENIPLPRLLNSSGNIQREIMPEHVSINLEITPLSYASMNLPQGEGVPARSYVELFTCMGSAGIFRVRSPQDTYGTDTATAELEHAVVEVGDYLVLAKYSQMMDAAEAMRTVFNHYRGSKWQLGNISALASSDVALEADHNRVLEAMLAILDQKPDCMMSFDFSTSPWTINVVSRGTTVAAEGRLARNLNYARVTYDDSELCTRAWYEKSVETEEGFDTEWAYVDADTMSTYGLIEREVQTGSNFTPSEALRVANQYISKHKNPRVNIETSLDELSCVTGEALDTFTIGKLCRLALPDYNVTIERHITGLAFPDVYGTPRTVNAKLAEEEDTAINFLHDLDTKGGSVSGGGGGGRKSDDAWKEFRTDFYQTDKNIGLVAEHVDHANNVLEAAGIDISTETGVLIYDDNVENGIGARFNLTEEQIRSEVYASNSQIWSEVVQTASYIRSEVHNSLSAFYTEILQTASSIVIRTGTDTETYHQPTAPTGTPDHPLVDGDLWFNSEGQFTWSDAEDNSWLDDSSYNWRNLVEADIYRYNGSEWVKIVNEQAIMQDTRFEQNNEHIQMVAGRVDIVDGNVESYRAEFKVEADNIRSTVSEQVAGLTSNVTQTAREIRSEVSAGNNMLRSEILQTATFIMMSVENKEDGLRSEILQTASMIRSSVSASNSQLYSAITQTASQIRLEVRNTNSNIYSLIEQNADGISSKVSKDGVISAINQSAESVDISASKINLSGYVTASSLESTNGLISSLRSGQASFSTVNTSSIRLAGYSLYLGSVTINGTTYNVVRYGSGD